MGATTGLGVIGSYGSSSATNLARLLSLIPNPDAAHGSGAIAVNQGGGHIDEMSPGAAAALRVEIAAAFAANGAQGSYTVTGADATANLVNISTGVTGMTLANTAVSVYRSGTNVTADAVITEPSDGVIRVADGSTYNTTAGDIINWSAR